MNRTCKYCSKEIWVHKINGIARWFEDQDYRIPHIHHGVQKSQNDHVLLTKTISRVSELERKILEISEKIGIDCSDR